MLISSPIREWVKRSVTNRSFGNHHSGSPGSDRGIPKRLNGITGGGHQVIILSDNLSVLAVIDSVFLVPILQMIEDLQSSGLKPCDHCHDSWFNSNSAFRIVKVGTQEIDSSSAILIG